jgi:hypothetical protein
MFWNAEDVQPAADVAVELFGKNGAMWYGDVDGDAEFINSLCSVLSQRIGQTAMVVDDNF